MTTNEIERCRDVSIHTLVGLTNIGRRVMIKCPFHNDGTASMAIYPNNGFHCFGCAKHGKNAIDFVKLLSTQTDERERFKEAVEELRKYI